MPAWNPRLESEKGKAETLTPNRNQAISMMAKGTRQSPVKAVDTRADGRFSGSLNMWRISGLGLLGDSWALPFPLSTAICDKRKISSITTYIQIFKKKSTTHLETGDQCLQCANSVGCSPRHHQRSMTMSICHSCRRIPWLCYWRPNQICNCWTSLVRLRR